MIYSSRKRHRLKVCDWMQVDNTLQMLENEKCDVLDVGVAGLSAYVFYREPYSNDVDLSDSHVDMRDLNALYVLYPKKAGKKAGIKRLASLIKTDEDYNRVQKAIINFSKYAEGKDQQYIPYFSSFVNRYLDDFYPENYEENTDKRFGFLDGQ